MSHLRFVVRIARGYTGYGLPQHDLIQEGTVGLMKAVRRFDPDMGVRLVSFAVHWIKAEIHEYILRNWRIVKVATTKAQRKLFFNLRSSKKRLGWFSQQEVERGRRGPRRQARDRAARWRRACPTTTSPSTAATTTTTTARALAPAAYLPDLRMEPSRQVETADTTRDENERLYDALEGLDERSRDILQQRWLTEQKDHVARTGGSVRRLGRAHSPDREERHEQAQRATGRLSDHCSKQYDHDRRKAVVFYLLPPTP